MDAGNAEGLPHVRINQAFDIFQFIEMNDGFAAVRDFKHALLFECHRIKKTEAG